MNYNRAYNLGEIADGRFSPAPEQVRKSKPRFGTFYRPERDRSVLVAQIADVARKAAGKDQSYISKTVRAIAASSWNQSHTRYTGQGYQAYNTEGPLYNKKYSTDPRSKYGSGNQYPVLWVPNPDTLAEPEATFGGPETITPPVVTPDPPTVTTPGAGPAGPPGPIGPAGPAGSRGAKGPAGSIGPGGGLGPAGQLGPRGKIGPPGEVGPAGPSGAAASKGSPGESGPPGAVGPSGVPGTPGPRGAAGPVGPPGEPGPPGMVTTPEGADIVAGPAGPPGSVGPPGAPGTMGPRGQAGPSGPTGAPGSASEEAIREAVMKFLDAHPPGTAMVDPEVIKDIVREYLKNHPGTAGGGSNEIPGLRLAGILAPLALL